MNRKVIAAGVAAGALAVAAGVGVTQSSVVGSSSCTPPRTILGSEQDASIAALEAYIEANVAQNFKAPATLQWASDDYSPVIRPGMISARVFLVDNSGQERYYHVTLKRECIGGDWEVVEFKRIAA